jgi:uncharacterized coiled-coil protein SlyX
MSPEILDRLTSLEIHLAELRRDMERLEEFVRAYEARISAVEKEIGRLKERVETPSPEMREPEDDLPPHY